MREWSPRRRARLAGVFEVLEGATSVFGQLVVPGMLVVGRDAALTASNILANESLYRVGIVSSLVAVVLHLAWGFMLYDLLRIVDRRVALFSLIVLVVDSGLQAVTGLILLAPIVILRSGESFGAFTPEQLQALALMFIKLNAQAYDIFLAFFGVWLVTIGYLVVRSTFMPRILGATLMLEGLGWAAYFSPPLGAALFAVTAALGVVAELPFAAWLLVKGADNQRWRIQAVPSGSEGEAGLLR